MHKKWKKHLPFLEKNVGKMTQEEMAKELNVDPMDLKLFLHRNRIFPKTEERSLAKELITLKFIYPEYFSPTRNFFEVTGIGQRRWWQLYRGEKKMTETEYMAVAEHLKVSLQEAFEARQLILFEK
jgi:hypothetical protein